MAIIRKKIGGEIQSFPYEEYWLDQDGNYKIHLSYKGESVKLRPYDYTNQNDLQYSIFGFSVCLDIHVAN